MPRPHDAKAGVAIANHRHLHYYFVEVYSISSQRTMSDTPLPRRYMVDIRQLNSSEPLWRTQLLGTDL
jgi:hypothetical protein